MKILSIGHLTTNITHSQSDATWFERPSSWQQCEVSPSSKHDQKSKDFCLLAPCIEAISWHDAKNADGSRNVIEIGDHFTCHMPSPRH